VNEQFAVVERKLVFRMRIIVAALATGCSVFLVVTLVLGQLAVPPQHWQLFGYLALGVGAAAVLAQAFIAQWILAEGRRRIVYQTFRVPQNTASEETAYVAQGGDRAKLMLTYFFRILVSCAIFDGAAFLLLIVYLAVDRSPWALAMGMMMIGLILVQFPLRGQLEQWLESQQRLIEAERQLRGL
jgi:hypothetical protein